VSSGEATAIKATCDRLLAGEAASLEAVVSVPRALGNATSPDLTASGISIVDIAEAAAPMVALASNARCEQARLLIWDKKLHETAEQLQRRGEFVNVFLEPIAVRDLDSVVLDEYSVVSAAGSGERQPGFLAGYATTRYDYGIQEGQPDLGGVRTYYDGGRYIDLRIDLHGCVP
jgi:hypothetical protein